MLNVNNMNDINTWFRKFATEILNKVNPNDPSASRTIALCQKLGGTFTKPSSAGSLNPDQVGFLRSVLNVIGCWCGFKAPPNKSNKLAWTWTGEKNGGGGGDWVGSLLMPPQYYYDRRVVSSQSFNWNGETGRKLKLKSWKDMSCRVPVHVYCLQQEKIATGGQSEILVQNDCFKKCLLVL